MKVSNWESILCKISAQNATGKPFSHNYRQLKYIDTNEFVQTKVLSVKALSNSFEIMKQPTTSLCLTLSKYLQSFNQRRTRVQLC